MNHYAVLGIPKNASSEEIKAAFHKKALFYHPDKLNKKDLSGKTEKEIETIKTIYNKKYEVFKNSYTVLMDHRAEYDSETCLEIDRDADADFIEIKKIDLVDKFCSDKFNEIFNNVNNKETFVGSEKNVNVEFAKLLAQRDILPEILLPQDNRVVDFSVAFHDINKSNISNISELAEYEPECIYSFANCLSEKHDTGIIPMNNCPSQIILDVEKLIEHRKLIDLKNISADLLEYSEAI